MLYLILNTNDLNDLLLKKPTMITNNINIVITFFFLFLGDVQHQ